MAFFKRIQKKDKLWYPQFVTWGKAVSTREVADELTAISTVTRGDTYAVMENLVRVRFIPEVERNVGHQVTIPAVW